MCDKSLFTFFQTVLSKNYGIPGIALAIRSLGGTADGIRTYTPWWLMGVLLKAVFLRDGKVDLRQLSEVFRPSVLK